MANILKNMRSESVVFTHLIFGVLGNHGHIFRIRSERRLVVVHHAQKVVVHTVDVAYALGHLSELVPQI